MDMSFRMVGAITAGLFVILILIVSGQVFWRYVLQSPIFWAEEFARILYVWMIMMALIISTKEGSQASVDLITKFIFRKNIGKVFAALFVHICEFFFSIFLVIYGFKLSHFVSEQVFPALDISYSIQYLAVPVSGIFLVLISIVKCVDSIQNKVRR